MNKIFMFIIAVLLTARPALAGLRVVTSYPYIADLVRQIGARDVEAVALAGETPIPTSWSRGRRT